MYLYSMLVTLFTLLLKPPARSIASLIVSPGKNSYNPGLLKAPPMLTLFSINGIKITSPSCSLMSEFFLPLSNNS